MAKRKETDAKPAAPTGDAVPSAPELKASEPKLEPKLEAKSDEPKLEAKPEPKLELPRVEAPMLAPIEEPAQAEKIVPKADPIKAEAPKTEAHKAEVTKLRLAKSDVPKGDAPRLDWIKPLMAEDAPLPPRAAAVPAASPAPVRDSAPVGRFALLAASVAIAASIGAMAGGFGASGFTRVAAAPSDTPAVPAVAAEDIHALQSTVTQLRADLAGLKSSIDAGTKSTNGQFVKITERIDRVERAQAEPIAKINKAVEALERIEKRADLTPGRDVTGTVPTAQTAAASAPPQGIVSGWVVRDVYRGVAFIQGRMGVIEVEPGDVVPGVGRVEAVRKQDGRWVVVTSKGLITAPR